MIAVEEYIPEQWFPCSALTIDIAENYLKIKNFWNLMPGPNEQNTAFFNGNDK